MRTPPLAQKNPVIDRVLSLSLPFSTGEDRLGTGEDRKGHPGSLLLTRLAARYSPAAGPLLTRLAALLLARLAFRIPAPGLHAIDPALFPAPSVRAEDAGHFHLVAFGLTIQGLFNCLA